MPNRALSTLTAALVLLFALSGAAAEARVTPLSASLSDGSFRDFSQTNAAEGKLQISNSIPYDGGPSAEATYEGDGRNGYSRGIWNVDWQEGDSVSFRAAFYLPVGFLANVQGEVDLMRWDNWLAHPEDTDWGGIGIYGSDHRARLLRFAMDRPNETLVGPFDLPEGRWFTLQVRQRLSSDSGSFSEVLLDGKPVGRSARPNMYGRTIERIRFGIVAIAAGVQRKPLALRFADAGVAPENSIAARSSRPAPSSHRGRPQLDRRFRIGDARPAG